MPGPDSTQLDKASPFPIDNFILSSALDHAVDGLIVLNHNREVVYMNEAAGRIAGGQTVGVHCGTLLKCHDAKHPALRYDGCYGQCVFASEQPLSDIEMNIQGPDGRTIPVEVSYSYIPLSGHEPYLLMSLRDITDKKAVERARRQKEELRYTMQERERLARDLHDGVVQDIAFVNMQVKLMLEDFRAGKTVTAEQLQKISQVLDTGYGELRTAIQDLSIGISGNLIHHLSQTVLEFKGRTQIDAVLDCEPLPNLETSFVHQVTKIVQESLTNICKHAKATKASVVVRLTEPTQTLIVDIKDNGVGFTMTNRQQAGHYGMKTMSERAELLGGTMKLESALNLGTRVHLEIPLQ